MKDVGKWLCLFLFGPAIAVLALHVLAAALAALLPFLVLLAMIVGASAGLSASWVLRRRLRPPRGHPAPQFPVPPPDPVRRPRGPRRPQG